MSERVDVNDQENTKPPIDQTITWADIVRALFYPDDASQELVLPDFNLRERLSPVKPASSDLHTAPELTEPTTLSYADQQPAVAPVSSQINRLLLAGGIVTALIITTIGQALVSAPTGGGFGWIIIGIGALIWLGVLVLGIAPPDGAPLRRGPKVSGAAGARPLHYPELNATYMRIALGLAALTFSIATFFLTANNTFSIPGVFVWILSIICWLLVVAEQPLPDVFNALWQSIRAPQISGRFSWQLLLAVLLILAGGAFLRFYQLDAVPVEMTSDHVEKILDGYRVSTGITNVFFRGNGGREAIQFYLIALAHHVFGADFSFRTIKIIAAIESLVLLPVFVVWGREMLDRESGIFAAALLAISWWHIMLARLALRIVLTPLVFTFLLITLVRGIRTGQRSVWVWAGVWMGVGVYAYQALRITPLVATAAFIVASAGPVYLMLRANWKKAPDQHERQIIAINTLNRQGLNLVCAGIIALAFFIPMARVWNDYPADLWNRVINRTTNNETVIQGAATNVFLDNYRDALLMFNANGDAAWINAPPGTPALDTVTAMLLILGVVAWGVRIALRRDPADVFIIAAGLIMLLPTALAVAFPIENPSFTRASGVIPVVFLLAAWPLSILRQRWMALTGKWTGYLSALVMGGLLFSLSTWLNTNTYFVDYATSYQNAALNPREVAGEAKQSIGADQALDGVWLIGYPYWHDYRAIGIEAGDITFSNAIFDVSHLDHMLAEQPQSFTIRPLVFIVHPDDTAAQDRLLEEFPEGTLSLFQGTSDKDFSLFIVEK